ncbi:hypothetical protein QR680_006930 [Steinernema hermaphroditum]|uniref:Uncharacterized protein n=1 Tax=Steinernema hermaphroditum TaxID=289476 RepID=A0AA39LXW7_9BILA|nr:hypothetical protein QR680_006930 [Steinernema hermaphroditum]
MDSVPHRFCDDVATIMDGFLAINLDQIISKEWRSWRTVFKEHKEKRRTIQITAYAEDHETVRYQVQEHMMAPPPPGFGLALRRSQSFTLDELKKMDKKYIRVRALYVRKKREPNQPMLGLNLPALPLASWNDFICTVSGLPLWSTRNSGWFLSLSLEPQDHQTMTKFFKVLKKRLITSLTLSYTGGESEIFLQQEVEKGYLESLQLLGRWPNADHLKASIKVFLRSPKYDICNVSPESDLRGDFEMFRILFDRFLVQQGKHSSLTLNMSFSEDTMRAIADHRRDFQIPRLIHRTMRYRQHGQPRPNPGPVALRRSPRIQQQQQQSPPVPAPNAHLRPTAAQLPPQPVVWKIVRTPTDSRALEHLSNSHSRTLSRHNESMEGVSQISIINHSSPFNFAYPPQWQGAGNLPLDFPDYYYIDVNLC